jgi:hypothetical protein
MKAREQRRRASSIKAFVVVKDANPQTVDLRALKKHETAGLSSINGRAVYVKAEKLTGLRGLPFWVGSACLMLTGRRPVSLPYGRLMRVERPLKTGRVLREHNRFCSRVPTLAAKKLSEG